MCKLSDAYLAATVSSTRSLCHEVAQAEGATIAPPLDASVVPGRYAELIGLQKDTRSQGLEERSQQGLRGQSLSPILPAIKH